MTFKIGDRVKVKTRVEGYKHPDIEIGDTGVILAIDGNYIEIKFYKPGYGWWLPINSVTGIRKQPLKKRICLKINEMEKRHKVFLENKYGKLAVKA